MARKGGANEVGAVKVTIEGDNKPLKNTLQDSEQATKNTANRIDSSNKKIAGSFSETTDKIQKKVAEQVGAITGLIGSVTAAVGVFTLFVNIGKRLGEAMFGTTKRIKELSAEIKQLNELGAAINKPPVNFTEQFTQVEKKIADLTPKVKELEAELAFFYEGQFGQRGVSLSGSRPLQVIETQLKAARRELDELRKQRQALRDGSGRIERKEELEALEEAEAAKLRVYNDNLKKRAAAETEAAQMAGKAWRDALVGAAEEAYAKRQELARRSQLEELRAINDVARAREAAINKALDAAQARSEAQLERIAVHVSRMASVVERIKARTQP